MSRPSALQRRGAGVEVLAERGVIAIELAAHAGVLRALARKQEHDLGIAVRGAAPHEARALERGDRIRVIAHDHEAARLEILAAYAQRVCGVGKRKVGVGAQVGGESLGGGVEHTFVTGRQRQQMQPRGRRFGLLPGRFFDDHMSVCATDSETADTGSSRPASRCAIRRVCR